MDYQCIDLLQYLHQLFSCGFNSVVQFAQRLHLEVLGQKPLYIKRRAVTDTYRKGNIMTWWMIFLHSLVRSTPRLLSPTFLPFVLQISRCLWASLAQLLLLDCSVWLVGHSKWVTLTIIMKSHLETSPFFEPYPLSNHHQFTAFFYSIARQTFLHVFQWFPWKKC